MKARRRRRSRGFSLLEIMFAMAILGLALTGILSAGSGMSAKNRTAENESLAAGLVRCHMTELEERLVKLGYPEIEEIEPGVACCNSTRDERFECEHRIEKVELPQPAAGGAGDAGLDMVGNLGNSVTGSDLSLDGGLQGLGNNLMDQMGGGGAGGMLDMVMGLVYPSLKPMMEASIRRLTVTARWKEGSQERKLSIVQFVTDPSRAGMVQGDLFGDAGVPGLGGDGGTAAPTGTGVQSGQRVGIPGAPGGGAGGGAMMQPGLGR